MPNEVYAVQMFQAMLEKVRPKLVDLFEQTSSLSKRVKPREVERISDKLYRIPFRPYIGGTYQKYDPDFGVLGFGSGMKVDKMTAGYIYTNYAVALSQKVMDLTAGKEQAIISIFSEQMSQVVTETAIYDDITLHGAGDGILTASSSAVGTWSGGTLSTLTFASASDMLKVNQLRDGMAVQVYNSAGTTIRANATNPGYHAIIDHIDRDNYVVRLNASMTGLTTGDILVLADVTNPATHAFGQAGWPLSGDEHRHGIRYSNDVTGATYYLGVDRTTVPQLNPAKINASSSALVHNHILQMLDKLIDRRNADVTSGLIGLAHMAERAQLFNIGVSISEWQRTSRQEMLDLLPSNLGYDDAFVAAGVTHYLTKRQPRDRIDYINLDDWGRAEVHENRFHGEQFGIQVHPARASTGQLKAGWEFFYCQAFDWVNFDPGKSGVVYGLTPPAGW